MTKDRHSENIGRILKKLWGKPGFWAFIYLALIPTFAFVYYLLPNSFHHGTIRFEQYLEQDKKNIERKLQDAIISSFEKKHGAKNPVIENYRINSELFHIHYLQIDGKRYSFYLGYYLKNDNDTKYKWVNLSFYSDYGWGPRNGDWIVFHLFVNEKPDMTIKLEDLLPLKEENFRPTALGDFPSNLPEVSKGNEYGYLTVSYDFYDELQAYADGQQGFPSKSSGSFWRMLYLSAITITTVGFGDIVPITNFARVLVSSEAVLGIVLIGLFLNALTERIKK